MNKLILKFFKFLKNCITFLQIIILVFIISLLLYWIQELIGAKFDFLTITYPFIKPVIAFGEGISDGSIELFEATFEFKYAIGVILYTIIYFILQYSINIIDKIKELYEDGRKAVNKISENHLNKVLEKQTTSEELKINKYYVYISTSVKTKFSHAEQNTDINAENTIMNKFLIEKLGTAPKVVDNGFLYSFNNFNDIDNVVKFLFKLTKSNSKLDYIICLQTASDNYEEDMTKIKMVKNLSLINRVCMLTETSYRYKFNQSHMYGITKLGTYQKGESGQTYEVDELVEI